MVRLLAWAIYGYWIHQRRAQKFEKGRAQFPVSVSTENIGEDQKKGLHVFRRPIYSPKSSEDQKKGHHALRCLVSTVPQTGDIYISLNVSGRVRRGSSGLPVGTLLNTP